MADHDETIEIDEDEEGFTGTCWCDPGNSNCWFSTAYLNRTCGGSGTLHCYCGGDLCVCHNHGEIECDGCEDCEDQFAMECDDDY